MREATQPKLIWLEDLPGVNTAGADLPLKESFFDGTLEAAKAYLQGEAAQGRVFFGHVLEPSGKVYANVARPEKVTV